MADEQTRPPFNKDSKIPQGLDWQSLLARDCAELKDHYRKILESLGKGPGSLDMDVKGAI